MVIIRAVTTMSTIASLLRDIGIQLDNQDLHCYLRKSKDSASPTVNESNQFIVHEQQSSQ